MKMDKTGLIMVAGAALVLYAVVKKSTAGAPASGGQGGVGSGAAPFWSNVINNVGGAPTAAGSGTFVGQQTPGGVTLFGNGTFDAAGTYVDPGQVAYNTQTGQVQESPFSGMYGGLSPLTQGFGGYAV